MDTGDTAWVLAASALVLLMTPGVAFFYGGTRPQEEHRVDHHVQFRKHGVGRYSLGSLGLQPGLWPDLGGFIGNLEWFGLEHVDADAPGPYSDTIPHQAFMIFQAMEVAGLDISEHGESAYEA